MPPARRLLGAAGAAGSSLARAAPRRETFGKIPHSGPKSRKGVGSMRSLPVRPPQRPLRHSARGRRGKDVVFMHTVVERELELTLVLSPERCVPVPARLRYRSDDPFAVHISFHVGSEAPVNWTFARELLVEGVFRPSGHGDVRIWPTKVEGRSVVCLALSSPDGNALLEAPSSPVAAWLERTLRVVPPGTEHERLGMEDELSELLAPTMRERRDRDESRRRDPWPTDDLPEG